MKFRVGIAAALIAAGGGAIGVVALAATSGGAPTAAAQTGFSAHRYQGSAWTRLNTAMNDWRWSRQTSFGMLASMTQQTFLQTTQQGRTFAEQRGIVVLATKKFLILQSANGSLHLWLLSGRTVLQNVSSSVIGTGAMTGNTSATQQAMNAGNMNPAINLMAGSTQIANQMQAPTPSTQTVTVPVAGTDLTVTVTITRNTATVTQTATMPQNTSPWANWLRWRQNPWTTPVRSMLARGDLAMVVGFRSHGLLHAQLVLFSPVTTGGGTPTPTPTSTMTVTPTATPTATVTPTVMPTVAPTPTPVASSSVGSSGSHY